VIRAPQTRAVGFNLDGTVVAGAWVRAELPAR